MQRRKLFAASALAGACFTGSQARAQAATSRRLAEQFAATLTAHDMAAFAALFADDYRNHQTSAAAPPPPSTGKTGKQLSVVFFAARLAALPDLTVTPEVVVATEDHVAARTGVLSQGGSRRLELQEVPMTAFQCIAIPTDTAERFRATGTDDNGNVLRRMDANDQGSFPCRHCLSFARPGEPMLLGSYNLPRPLGIYWTAFVNVHTARPGCLLSRVERRAEAGA